MGNLFKNSINYKAGASKDSNRTFNHEKAMYTTSAKTFKSNKSRAKKWLHFLEERNMVMENVYYCFVDGSSTGWHSAVLVDRDNEEVIRRCRFVEKTEINNVSAELEGVELAPLTIPSNSEVILVHDYIGCGAWTIGAWEMRNEIVTELVKSIKKIIKDKNIKCTFVHHAGHQKDASDFTRLNNAADQLCTNQIEM